MSDQVGPGDLRITLRGPGVTLDSAIEVGHAAKELLKAVAESQGNGDIEWAVTSLYFQCDGCGLQIPTAPSVDEGWTYRDGDDLCPACSGKDL